MPIWGPDDTFGRWMQLICGVPLFLAGLFAEWHYWITPFDSTSVTIFRYGGLGMILIGIRCIWYALTGRGKVSGDDF